MLHLSSYTFLLFICYTLRIVTHMELLPTWDCYPLGIVTHFYVLPTLTCYPHAVVKHLYQFSCFPLALIFLQFLLSFVNNLEPCYPLYLFPTFIYYQFTAVTIIIYLYSFFTFICYPLEIVTHMELVPTWDCYPLLFFTHFNLFPTFSC